MPQKIAYRMPERVPRRTHFLAALPDLHKACLPERKGIAHLSAVQLSKFKTTRLRPEIWEIIEALRARFMATRKVELTVSEIVAAAFIEALPSMVAKGDFGA